MSFKMESPCGRHDEWLGISIYVLYFHASSVFEHMSNYVLQHVRIYISWWSRRGSFFVHVCGILIDFLWLYEKKKQQFMLDGLYFSFAINSDSYGTLIMHHVHHAVSQQSFTLSQASTASQSWAALTDQSAEVLV